MANYYVKIYAGDGLLRKFGGTKRKIYELIQSYHQMNGIEFLEKHPHLSIYDYNNMKCEIKRR